MFCVNCGKEISQLMKFCPHCGSPVAAPAEKETPAVQEPEVQETAPVAEPVQETPVQEVPVAEPVQETAPVQEPAPQKKAPKKKKKPLFWVIVAAAVILLAVLGVAFGDNLFYAVIPAETRLQLAYAGQVKTLAADVSTIYDQVLEGIDSSVTGTGELEVEVSEQFLKDALGQDLGVNTLQLSYEMIQDMEQNRIGLEMTVSCQKTKLADLQVYLDMQAGEMIIHIPDVFQQPIRAELDMDYDAAAVSGMLASMDFDFMPEGALIEKLLPKLVKVAVMEVDDVEAELDSFSAGGVKQTATCLTATITEETIYNMAIAVLKELKSDKDIKAVIKDFYAVMGESFGYYEDADEFYKEYTDALSATIADLRDMEGDEEICEILTYVDGNNDILAIELQAEGGKIFFGEAKKGAERGFELSVKVDGETMLLAKSKGTEKGKLYNGKFTLEYEGEEYLIVDLKDMNTEKWVDGTFSGKMTLRLGEAAAMQMPSLVSTAKLVITADTADNSGKMTLEVFVGDTSMGKITMQSKVEMKGSVTMPTGAVDAEYADFPNIQVLFDRLKEAGVDEDLVDDLYWSFLYGVMY